MHLRCPHCQNPIELADLPSGGEITCVGCGSSFQLDKFATATFSTPANKRIGKFEILATVGHGAFGTVFKARDSELDRTVAIKVPRASNVGPGPEDVDRFLREARSVAQLRFPSIISIYEVGADNGTPYLVCDFVEGVTLADYLTGRGFSFKESAKLLAEVADALQYAHSLGVVHRDVKPSNIMIRHPSPSGRGAGGEGESLQPVLMDFGLAKRDAGEITMTIDGQILGTPAYMSPEQARGDAHKVDGRSDVYSLGVILYQLLTGELPFRGNKAMLLHQVLHEEPQRPRALNDKIPRDLETIALKAMAKEPGRRYVSAKEMAEDLRRWLAGEPILARAVGTAERLWRWCKRKPALASLSATLAAVILVAFAVVAWQLNVTTAALQRESREKNLRALALVNSLRNATPQAVPSILADVDANRVLLLPTLQARFADESDRGKRMRLALALLPVEPERMRALLAAWMVECENPMETLVVRDTLLPHAELLADHLWRQVGDTQRSRSERFRALTALATFDPASPRWTKFAPAAVEDLLTANALHLGGWVQAMRPARQMLVPALCDVFRGAGPADQRQVAAAVLADYASDQPPVLVDLLLDADVAQFHRLFPSLKNHGDQAERLLLAELRRPPIAATERLILRTTGAIEANEPQHKTRLGFPTELPGKLYDVRLEKGKAYQFTMESSDFECILILHDKIRALTYDEGRTHFNSCIGYMPVEDDICTVLAASQNGTGHFVLTIKELISRNDEKEKLAKRQANAAAILARMDRPEHVWPLLKHSPDPRLRSYVIHRLGPLAADARTIANRLDEEPDITARRALILSLGAYEEKALAPGLRQELLPRLQGIYRTSEDPGLHAAAEWLLRTWNQSAWLKQTQEEWTKDRAERTRRLEIIGRSLEKNPSKSPSRWYVDGRGHTMVILPGPVEFTMGSPITESESSYRTEHQHTRRIGRTFALSAKPLTVEQYFRSDFDKSPVMDGKYTRVGELPMVGVSWLDAAEYCNWLSKEEGIPKEEWCFEIDSTSVRLKENYLSLTGYRLPTEAEFEYAMRAGTSTARYYGETDELLPWYAWFQNNSQNQTWPVGSLKPNDWGFFDMFGNVHQWCQEQSSPSYASYGVRRGVTAVDKEGRLRVPLEAGRVTRGSSFRDPASSLRSARRGAQGTTVRVGDQGFRVARTLRPANATPAAQK